MEAWKKHWGVEQWAAYFETKKLPVMSRSKQLLLNMEESKGEQLSPKELSSIALSDPLLCLHLLREAEQRKTHRLENETTTALAAILQLGIDEFQSLLLSSVSVDETNTGLLEVESRSSLACQIALRWAAGRNDVNPEEVAVAALLADTGELLLWVYAPELAQAAKDELHSGRARRSSMAQTQACGFDFKQLTIRCSEIWHLPSLLRQLLRGAETVRAQLTRISTNVARHLTNPTDTSIIAIAFDLADAHQLLPSFSLEWLVDGLVSFPNDKKEQLIELTRQHLD